MDYETAKAIAIEAAPGLHIDDFNPAIPSVLVVRKDAKSAPFNIMLPNVPENHSIEDIPGREAIPEQPAIEATDDHPGRPAIPAQPAIKPRTKAGQIAEIERSSLLDAIKSAGPMLR